MKLAFDVYEPIKNKNCLNPIVLLHSLMETKSTWKRIAQPIADMTERKVYAYDARSHGDSPWTEDYSIDLLVSDLNDFLRDHSLSKIVLIGHSLGGKVAITYSLKHSDRVESLIVEDVPVRNFKHRHHNLVPFAVKMVKQMSEDFRAIDDRKRAERHIRQLGHRFADFIVVDPQTVEEYDMECLPIKWTGNFYQLTVNIDAVADALRLNKFQPHITGHFTGNAMFILGGRSQFKAYEDPLIGQFFPNAVKVTFKEAGHFLHQTLPKEYVEEVTNFINKNNGVKAKY